MIEDDEDDGVIPLGYERSVTGEVIPSLETDLVARWRTRSIVNLANRPELWPIAARAYATYGRPSAAAAAVGVTTATIRNLWKSNQDFDALMTEAHEEYAAKVQDEIRRRAIDGVERNVLYKGEIVDTYREYSDSLLVLEARRAHPEYREILATPRQGQTTVNVNTSSVAVSGSPAAADALASLQAAQLTPEQRAALRALVTRTTASEPVAGTPALLDVSPQGDAPVGSGGVHPGPHQEPQYALPTPQHAPGTGRHAAGSAEPALGTTHQGAPAGQPALPSTHHAATSALRSTEHGDRARGASGAEVDPPEPAGGAQEAPGLPQDGSDREPGR